MTQYYVEIRKNTEVEQDTYEDPNSLQQPSLSRSQADDGGLELNECQAYGKLPQVPREGDIVLEECSAYGKLTAT